jgi:glutamate 5-kinase
MMGAEKLVLLTDVDGLYASDPRKNPKAKLIPYREKISKDDFKRAGQGGGTARGTGGMYSKLLAADFAAKHGIVTHLVKGDHPQNLILLAEGESLGTQIGGKFGAR